MKPPRHHDTKFRQALLAWCLGVLVVNPVRAADPLLDATDEHYIELALRALKMSPSDLGFKKDHVESDFINAATLRYLQAPLTLPVAATATLNQLRTAANLTDIVAVVCPVATAADTIHHNEGHYTVDTAIERITAAAERIHFPPPQPSALAAYAAHTLSLTTNSPELAEFPAATRSLLDRQAALELEEDELAQMWIPSTGRYHSLLEQPAVGELIRVVQEAADELRRQPQTGDTERTVESPLGLIVIGGAGPNMYQKEAFLIIDPGGDDVYENSAGGANGLAQRPISIVIDLAGNDRYVSRHSFSQGAGIFGIGILVDCAGDDVYEAKHLSQGSGFFGCGLLADYGGRDVFDANSHSQGAATFGTGILWQRGDDSRYEARYLSQGFGGVQGTGLLLDDAGNDTYTATGGDSCGWLPGHRFTLSQGFGYGARPFAGGGLGILADLTGNDHYVADVYGQGASYWYAVGMLLDATGNDTYEAYQYCQGAGIHLSNGVLADWAGNDSYTAHAICQGGAHDYSVGILIDRAGNDHYTGDSTAQGTAINNSFALLLDKAGDDTYTGTDPKQSQAAGHDGGRREYGSIALLLDLAGKDTYSQGQPNDAAWRKPFYGCGLDVEASATVVGAASPPRPMPEARRGRRSHEVTTFVDPHHPVERLLRLALSDQPEAEAAWKEIQDRGVELLPYLLTRVNSPNVSIRAKIEELIDHLSTNSVPALITGIDTATNDEQARLCAYFLARFESATNAIPAVLPLLKREQTQTTALYTLGHLRAHAAFNPAIRFLRDDRETIRLRAAQALGRIGDNRAAPKLIPLLDDSLWDVRYAAQEALVALHATTDLRRTYAEATPRARPHLIEALTKLGDPRAQDLAQRYWQHDSPVIRDVVRKQLQP